MSIRKKEHTVHSVIKSLIVHSIHHHHFKAGSIHLSEIEQIRKSIPGNPGYKISTIVKDEDTLGTINKNGIYGIFGSWNDAYKEVLAEPLEIMHPTDLKDG